ncbi:MAG: BON domain-containing protein [Gammaproteobacteria bacterium]|nr:BON domain-containing protein [Gammaproteobacteria bacterium]MBU1440486.1 BON domain-containing protein [Gammaproteobacteria bacterium]MBU2286594.1 BON domain-containing protein [Gammaproteobacteria bacterium]MBU2410307.1 BON domain-containing protein [Gammaproteobacteria bacterium]
MNELKTSRPTGRHWAALVLTSGVLALAACGDKAADQPTAAPQANTTPPVVAPQANTDQAAVDAKAKAEQMTSDAKTSTESAASSAGASMKQGAEDAKEGVKSAGSTVARVMDDAAITASISTGLAKDSDLSAVKIDVDTKNGDVVLKGPAPNAAAKERAEAIAKTVEGVKSVDNQLVIKTM